jgi:hypothetical protein
VVPYTQCPRIDEEFIAEERALHGDVWVKQEYCCSFEHTVDAAFAEEAIKRAVSEGLEAVLL